MIQRNRPTALALSMMGLLGLSSGSLALSIEPTQQLEKYFTSDIALADFDGDGDQDMVTTRTGDTALLWLNDGTGQFSDAGMELGESGDRFIVVGDFSGSDAPDLLLGATGGAAIYENDGSAGFTKLAFSMQGTEDSEGGWAAGDVDGDGILDIVTLGGTFNSASVDIWYGKDGYNSTPDETLPLDDASCKALGLAPLDGNPGDEIVIGCNPDSASGTDHPGGIAAWNYDSVSESMDALTAGLNTTDWDIRSLGFVDFNGDGSLDVVGTHFNSHINDSIVDKEHSVWTNDGSGGLSAGAVEFEGEDVAIADMDGDGTDDMVVVDGSVLRYYRVTDAGFDSYQNLENCSAYGVAVDAGDVNNDSKIDLVLASRKNFTSDDEADLVLIQGAENGVCPNDGGGGFGDVDDDDDSDSDDDSSGGDSSGGGGGALPVWLLAFLPVLLMRRRA